MRSCTFMLSRREHDWSYISSHMIYMLIPRDVKPLCSVEETGSHTCNSHDKLCTVNTGLWAVWTMSRWMLFGRADEPSKILATSCIRFHGLPSCRMAFCIQLASACT